MENAMRGLVFWLSLVCFHAFAFESSPEFQSLTEEEHSLLEAPSELGAEYSSDVLSYLKPWHWEYSWLNSSAAFDTSVGSVSAAHFRTDSRAKFYKSINEVFEFRLTWFDERDRESQGKHAIFEFLSFPLSIPLGLSLYGEPSLYKREDDTGLALLYRPSKTHEIRAFRTFVDVTRIRRNDQRDRFVEPDVPASYGVVGRARFEQASHENGGEGFFEYAFRHEPHTRWEFPDSGELYTYDRSFASAWWAQAPLEVRAQWDRKRESKSISGSIKARDRTRLFLLLAMRLPIGAQQGFEPGIEWVSRKWKTEQGVVETQDLIPHVWYQVHSRLRLGVLATAHGIERDAATASLVDSKDEDSIEARFNLSYAIFKKEDFEFSLMTTFDLDEFGTARSWDGGQGNLRMSL